MTDAEYIACLEQNYRRLPDPPRFSLLEFTGMTPDEYAEWIMHGTVPERVMRVAGRRAVSPPPGRGDLEAEAELRLRTGV
jgi:hypothetical protein